MLALTYGVRQPSVTADPLTYRIGFGVGLRNIPTSCGQDFPPFWLNIAQPRIPEPDLARVGPEGSEERVLG